MTLFWFVATSRSNRACDVTTMPEDQERVESLNEDEDVKNERMKVNELVAANEQGEVRRGVLVFSPNQMPPKLTNQRFNRMP